MVGNTLWVWHCSLKEINACFLLKHDHKRESLLLNFKFYTADTLSSEVFEFFGTLLGGSYEQRFFVVFVEIAGVSRAFIRGDEGSLHLKRWPNVNIYLHIKFNVCVKIIKIMKYLINCV